MFDYCHSLLVFRKEVSYCRWSCLWDYSRYDYHTYLSKIKKTYNQELLLPPKKILQYAVILLGFGMNLSVVLQTGKQSLPIILATISTSFNCCLPVT